MIKKVLLIEDDEDDFFLTKSVFSKIPNAGDYELSWVDTYDKGINAIIKHQYDIYLVDYRLGRETGIQLLKEAVAYNILEPIIILTGKGDYNIDKEAMNLGAADYLIKDKINPDSLDRSLRYALKQSENMKAIAESENKFRIIFDKAKDPIVISDFTGQIYDINKAGKDFFEISTFDRNLLNERNFFNNPEDRERFLDILNTKGAISDFECEMISTKGKNYFCSLSSSVQIDTKNMIEIYHTIVHDLSYRKKQEAQSINKGKVQVSEYIAKGFAEEIRNPLSTINLLLYNLADDDSLAFNEQAQSSIEEVRTNLDAINELIKNFVSSTEANSPILQHTSINETIASALAEVDDLIMGQRVNLQNFLLTHDIQLMLDAEQIKTALVNLFTNAIENMTGFPKSLSISSMNDSGFYSIMIEDNGKTIDANDEQSIFEPFFSTKKEAKGLGLTEANRIILAHGGQIIYRRQEVGNMFVIQLPIN